MPKTTAKHIRIPKPGTPSGEDRKQYAHVHSALDILRRTPRGRAALKDFQNLAQGEASGLDLDGMSALVTLVKAFAFGGERDFGK